MSDPDVSISSEVPSSPAGGSSAADDAKARREARKNRILNKGNDRLAKLTKQARGDEAEMLYPSTPPKPATPTSSSAAMMASTTGAPRGDDDDPEEVDISSSNQARMDSEISQAMEMFQRQQQQQQQEQQPQQAGPQDPMQQMMAALMGGGAGGAGGPPPGMPDLSQLFAAMSGQSVPPQFDSEGNPIPQDPNAPPPGFPQSGFFGPQGKVERTTGPSFFDRIFSLAHVVIFCFLGYYAVSSTIKAGFTPAFDIDSSRSVADHIAGGAASTTKSIGDRAFEEAKLHKWASLAYYRPALADADFFRLNTGSWFGFLGGSDASSTTAAEVSGVPLFWLFITLEVLLQSSRVILFQSRPPPSSLLFSLASQLPFPTLQWVLRIGARYATLLSSFLDDVAVLVFVIGVGILWCASKVEAARAI